MFGYVYMCCVAVETRILIDVNFVLDFMEMLRSFVKYLMFILIPIRRFARKGCQRPKRTRRQGACSRTTVVTKTGRWRGSGLRGTAPSTQVSRTLVPTSWSSHCGSWWTSTTTTMAARRRLCPGMDEIKRERDERGENGGLGFRRGEGATL